MSDLDYYQILEVEPDATASELQEAYHRLIQKRYAQRGKDIETAVHIQQVSEAYTILGNPVRRAQYDLDRMQSSATTETDKGDVTSRERLPVSYRPPARPRTQWYLMAGILLLGLAAILSAVLQGLYWLPVMMIVALCVAMNLLAILLTRDGEEQDLPRVTDESNHQLQT
jgi:Flp pilus assembly protein TadB